MTTRTDLLKLLRRLPGVLFVEPTAEVFDQGELHEAGRALRRERGLAESHPYIGWHSQQNAFDRKGGLPQPQRIYHGGDHTVVREALQSLEPAGFAVIGGRTEEESFSVFPDASPTGVDADQESAWRQRLIVLSWDQGAAALRAGEDDALRQVLRAPHLVALQPDATRVLRERSLLTHDDLAVVLAPEGIARLAASRRPGAADSELTRAVVYAFETGYPHAATIAAALAAEGKADAAVLTAWGGPEALRAAREQVLSTGRGSREFLQLADEQGEDLVATVIALAEDLRAAGTETAVTESIASDMAHALHGPSWTLEMTLQAVRDRRLPSWLRARIAQASTRKPRNPAEQVANVAATGKGIPATVITEWNAAVDEARADAGLPPSAGFDVTGTHGHQAVIENRDFMLATHLEGMRAALRDPEVNEPTAAVLLEVLREADELTEAELDALLVGWRKRFFVKPDPYTPAPPAIITLAMAAIDAQHPDAATIVQAILKDERQWTEGHYYAVIGAIDANEATVERLMDEADESVETRHAVVQIIARVQDQDPIQVAAQLLVNAPAQPPYLARSYATIMISFAEPGSDLWPHYYRQRSTVSLRAALQLAADPALPVQARRLVLAEAQSTSVLDHPENATTRPHPDEIARLRAEMERVTAELS